MINSPQRNALRNSFLGLFVVLGLSFVSRSSEAKVDSLPPSFAPLEQRLSETHEKGIRDFFARSQSDCDNLEVLHMIYRPGSIIPGAPALFKVESRVHASCVRDSLWYCQSTFESRGRGFQYTGTDCEDDSLVFDEQ